MGCVTPGFLFALALHGFFVVARTGPAAPVAHFAGAFRGTECPGFDAFHDPTHATKAMSREYERGPKESHKWPQGAPVNPKTQSENAPKWVQKRPPKHLRQFLRKAGVDLTFARGPESPKTL